MGLTARVKAGLSFNSVYGNRRDERRSAAVLIASTMLGCINLYAPVAAYAQQQPAVQAINFDIPAQPLSSAISRFIRATGWEVGFNSPTVVGKQSSSVKGSMTPAQALRALLAGTGLNMQISGSSTAALVAEVNTDEAIVSDGSTVLGTITVQGAGGITEGSGSYNAEIMNTGTKLSLSAHETPQSVSVVTRQKIDDKKYQSLEQAINDTAGMSVDHSLGDTRMSYNSRGLEVDNIQYDGMSNFIHYYTRDVDPADDLDLYDRVEIMRGAAGITQGFGNPSGAINLVRKRPLRENKTVATAEGSSWGNGKAVIDSSRILNAEGTIRGRFVGSLKGGDGYRDFNSTRLGTVYTSLDFDLSESTVLGIGYSYKKEKIDGYDWIGLVTRPDGSFFDFEPSTYLGFQDAYANRQQHALYADLTYEFDNSWTFRTSAKASWAEADIATTSINYYNSIYSHFPVHWDYGNDVYSFDTNISGPLEFLGHSHDFVVGTNISRSDLTLLNSWGSASVFDPRSWDPKSGQMPDPFTPAQDYDYLFEQYGIYAQTRLNVTDNFNILAGGRLTWFKTGEKMVSRLGNGDTEANTRDNAKFVPYIAGVIDVNDDVNIYASYTSIFKPQAGYYDVNGVTLAPVEGTNFEIGSKANLLDGRMDASVAIFQTNRDNVADQVAGVSYCNPIAYACYEGVDGIRTRGLEIELTGEILPYWNVAFGYTYAISKYTEGSNSGDKFSTYSYPEQIGKFFTTYTFLDEKFTVGGGFRAQSSLYYNSSTLNIRQSPYAVVDVMARYEFDDATTLQLNINNLFDKEYYSGLNNYQTGFRMGAPREFRLSLSREF